MATKKSWIVKGKKLLGTEDENPLLFSKPAPTSHNTKSAKSDHPSICVSLYVEDCWHDDPDFEE